MVRGGGRGEGETGPGFKAISFLHIHMHRSTIQLTYCIVSAKILAFKGVCYLPCSFGVFKKT